MIYLAAFLSILGMLIGYKILVTLANLLRSAVGWSLLIYGGLGLTFSIIAYW